MPAPSFVGAGAGSFAATGTGTASKTGCTAGNLILVHFAVGGTTEDYTFTNRVNLSNLAGAAGFMDGVVNARFVGFPAAVYYAGLHIGRATANGTCSTDYTVGASGQDLFVRMYEFTAASTATTVATVLEEGTATNDGSSGTGATVSTVNDMTTNGSDRLGLQFVTAAGAVTIGEFTGESAGVNFVEAVAEYSEAGGQTCMLSLQTATITNATTNIGTGTATLSASDDWGVIYTSIIPLDTGLAWIRA